MDGWKMILSFPFGAFGLVFRCETSRWCHETQRFCSMWNGIWWSWPPQVHWAHIMQWWKNIYLYRYTYYSSHSSLNRCVGDAFLSDGLCDAFFFSPSPVFFLWYLTFEKKPTRPSLNMGSKAGPAWVGAGGPSCSCWHPCIGDAYAVMWSPTTWIWRHVNGAPWISWGGRWWEELFTFLMSCEVESLPNLLPTYLLVIISFPEQESIDIFWVVPPPQGDNITNRMFIFLHFGDLKLHLHLPHVRRKTNADTLPETNIAHENTIFPGKYHQNAGFSMAFHFQGGRWQHAMLLLRGLEAELQSETWMAFAECRSLRGIRMFVRLVRE